MAHTVDELQQELRNIGPQTAQALWDVGIHSYEDLEQHGVEEVFMMLHQSGHLRAGINAAYLYALEGALCDCDWRAISPERKAEFRELTQQMRSYESRL